MALISEETRSAPASLPEGIADALSPRERTVHAPSSVRVAFGARVWTVFTRW